MRTLAFDRAIAITTDGKPVRAARFPERSLLPPSAACLVANGVRETLGALFERPASVRVCEPAIPSPDAWRVIAAGAIAYRVRGSAAEAALVLRPPDALALAALAFGETGPPPQRDLSAIEREVLDRTMRALAEHLAALCGARDPAAPVAAGPLPQEFSTYIQLEFDAPLNARIGIAVSREPSAPQPEPRPVEHLGDVPVQAAVTLELTSVRAAELARLAVGDFVPITSQRGLRGSLRCGVRTLARGRCGVRNGRYALTIDET